MALLVLPLFAHMSLMLSSIIETKHLKELVGSLCSLLKVPFSVSMYFTNGESVATVTINHFCQ